MKSINFGAVLKTIDGRPLVDDGHEVTLADVAINALLANHPNEPPPSAEEKIARWKLAQAIQALVPAGLSQREIALTDEDAARIKRLVGSRYLPLIVGQAFAMMENQAATLP